ncbi:hypothetical protein PO909_012256 [Leuciscus waleckii]
MYHIVIFETTNEVEVVPHNWVRDNVCMWPPYKYEDRVKAIKSMVKPGPSWTPFKIRIIFTRETYEEARQKLPEAEINTDLTDVDSPPVRRDALKGHVFSMIVKLRMKQTFHFQQRQKCKSTASGNVPAEQGITLNHWPERTQRL